MLPRLGVQAPVCGILGVKTTQGGALHPPEGVLERATEPDVRPGLVVSPTPLQTGYAQDPNRPRWATEGIQAGDRPHRPAGAGALPGSWVSGAASPLGGCAPAVAAEPLVAGLRDFGPAWARLWRP